VRSFDVFIIGAGQAGPPLARALAKRGLAVAIAERKHMGGSCINFGCTPTKAAIASARVAHLARRGGEYGVDVSGVSVDFRRVIERARGFAASFRDSLRQSFAALENPLLIENHARLDGREDKSFLVRAGNESYAATHVVLNTGTRTLIPPMEGVSGVPFLHAGNWLDRTTLPRRLIILGGGGIGLEMAQFYRRMGSEVAIVESSERIAPIEDEDVSAAIAAAFAAEDIEIHTNARVAKVSHPPAGIHVTLANGDVLQGSDLFVATGRTPNTDDLGLETVGVRLSKNGFVEADDRLSTSVDRIWAGGDIRGGPMFTHTAWDDHRIIESQIAGDKRKTTSGRVVPYAIFTDPEVGRVGITETEARKTGRQIRVLRYDMAKNAKARESGETQGFVKFVIDAATEQLLGAAIVSANASELVHVCIDLMHAKAPMSNIRDAIYVHPTLAEALQSTALLKDSSPNALTAD
jgi:pyruvate/2-oxoglutarate dehydrogenase complex dihydrolipoamide dehydrogenase (E3) component